MGYSDRIKLDESKKSVCPVCKRELVAAEIYENGILWICRGCDYSRNEHYHDPGRVAYESRKAWEN